MMNVSTTYLTDSHKTILYKLNQNDALTWWFNENNDVMMSLVIKIEPFLIKKIPS